MHIFWGSKSFKFGGVYIHKEKWNSNAHEYHFVFNNIMMVNQFHVPNYPLNMINMCVMRKWVASPV
jgi:hypothetical protein